MAEIRETLATYRLLTGARIKSQMQYKISFILSLLATLVSSGVDLAVIVILFGHIKALAGWTLPEVCLLYGVSSVAFGISELIFGGFDRFGETIRLGEFDSVLVRPIRHFTYIISSEFLLRRIGRILQGLGALGYGLSHIHGTMGISGYILLILAISGGVMAYGALLVVQATACFWSVEGLEVFNILTYGGNELLSHPLDIYAGYIRRFFIFAVPLAFINYVPVGSALGKTLTEGLPGWMGWVSPVVGPSMLILARCFWGFGVSHYQSTGN